MDILYTIFGEGDQLTFWHMGSRAVVIFWVALLCVRIAGRRTFGLHAPLDNIIVLLLGSILARPIVGASDFGSTVFAALVMVSLHRLLARVAVNRHAIGKWAKGAKTTLFHHGTFDEDAMRYCAVSKDDIHEEIRLKTGEDSLENIEFIYMERNGAMSMIMKIP